MKIKETFKENISQKDIKQTDSLEYTVQTNTVIKIRVHRVSVLQMFRYQYAPRLRLVLK